MTTTLTAADVVRTSPCLIVANPCAAGVSLDVVREIEQRLARAAPSVRVEWTESVGHAAAIVEGHSGLVVSVGGDGTLLDLVQSLADSPSTVVCVLPVGSGNSTARNLFGDRTWAEVLELIDAGSCSTRAIDLLHLVEPDVVSVLGASTGFLAQVLVDAQASSAGLTGIDRYYAAAGAVLQAMPAAPTRVTVDGVVLSDGSTSSVTVGGGRFRARSFQFLPHSVLDDGRLDVSTIDALDADAVATLVPLVPAGRHLACPQVHYATGHRVVIESTDGSPLVAEFDGTVWDGAGARLTVEIRQHALSVLTSEGI